MSLDHILLGLLRTPASGYDLKKVFDEGIGHFWAAELSQIYPTLKRLEQRQWLRSRRAPARRGPGRRVYQTTRAGRRALANWLAGGPQLGDDDRFSYLAQIYLMDELGDLRQTLKFFLLLRDNIAKKLESLRQLERRWAAEDPGYPDALPLEGFHPQLTLRYGLMTLAAKLRWCNDSIRRLRARLASSGQKPRSPKKEARHGTPVSNRSLAAHRRRLLGAGAVLHPGCGS